MYLKLGLALFPVNLLKMILTFMPDTVNHIHFFPEIKRGMDLRSENNCFFKGMLPHTHIVIVVYVLF